MQKDATPLPSGVNEADDVDRPAAASTEMPRLLAFYQDTWDSNGTLIGWRTIAWGLAFRDGSAVSIPVGHPVAVTLWHSVEDAALALDAYVDAPAPTRRPAGPVVSPIDEARASTTQSRGSLDGIAARRACPNGPADAGEGRDRSPGDDPGTPHEPGLSSESNA